MQAKVLALREFLGRYCFWIVVLLLLNVLAWAILETLWRWCVVPDKWPVRMYLLSGLLLFDNLCVLWWYAYTTHQQVEISQQQYQLANKLAESASRPCVVIEWRHVPTPAVGIPSGHIYVAKNIGPGLAVTTIWIDDLEATTPWVVHLGAIEPGGAIELPQNLLDRLRNEVGNAVNRKRHLILAEPLTGDVWTVSRNLVEQSGRLSHQISWTVISEQQRQQIHRETGEEYIRAHWLEIQRNLDHMLNALEGKEPKEAPL